MYRESENITTGTAILGTGTLYGQILFAMCKHCYFDLTCQIKEG